MFWLARARGPSLGCLNLDSGYRSGRRGAQKLGLMDGHDGYDGVKQEGADLHSARSSWLHLLLLLSVMVVVL